MSFSAVGFSSIGILLGEWAKGEAWAEPASRVKPAPNAAPAADPNAVVKAVGPENTVLPAVEKPA